MAVSHHRLKLLLVFILEFGSVLPKLFHEPCKEDMHSLQHHTRVLTCINMSTDADVQVLQELLNDTARTVLRLQDSVFGMLPEDAFTGSSIASLYVISSGLREVPSRMLGPICGASLQVLYISKNHITVIPDGSFIGCSKIRTMDLSSNGIGAISRRAFRGLDSLEELNLQFNDIRVFTGLEGLGVLRTLFLTSNGMNFVDRDALRGMVSLTTLDLSYNRLTTLDAGTLEPMAIKDKTIWNPRRYVFLEGNPWNCTCSLRWLHEWLLENGFPKNDPECATPEKGPLMEFDLCNEGKWATSQGTTIAILSKIFLILLCCALITL